MINILAINKKALFFISSEARFLLIKKKTENFSINFPYKFSSSKKDSNL